MAVIEKAPYGTPCNNCGLCCREELCPLAGITFPGEVAPCPALEVDGDRQVCGLIASPARYAPIGTAIYGVDAMRDVAMIAIGVGVGCDAQVEGEFMTPPPAEYIAAIRRIRPSQVRLRRIMKLWGDRC